MSRAPVALVRNTSSVMVNCNKPFSVVIGVILDDQQAVLLAKRPDHKPFPGLWEFPGGKIEANETAVDALKRELHEELGIIVLNAKPFLQFAYAYPDRHIQFEVFLVTDFKGELRGCENQALEWVAQKALTRYTMPAASHRIVEALFN